ncbi:MAG TPA: DNA-3-methyladenine glycosylase [Candidatus Thermoplasmatota archaeon]|nr:DNA-3-methyladenine glycosylase [Candidatus Thermoplasmatota archaeon]
MLGRRLPRAFFARDADLVARDLLGRVLAHETPDGLAAARIVETEAYFGPAGSNPHLATRDDLPVGLRRRLLAEGDPASHSFVGVTARNAVMYGPPGFAYVYLIYGMHECMNVVTGPERDPEPQAVLVRAGEPVAGVDLMRARRPNARRPKDLGSGPAKLAKALGITRALYGADMCAPGAALRVHAGEPVARAQATPRVNVVGGEDLPLRFLVPGDPHVSGAKRAGGARHSASR